MVCATWELASKIEGVARGDPARRETWSLVLDLVLGHKGPYMAGLAKLGLTPPQATALRVLDPERSVPMKDLAERLACDASTLTGIVDRLESRGLVERRGGGRDRRVKVLALTPKGKGVRERALERMTDPPAALATLSPTDQRALRDILRRLNLGGGHPESSER